MTIDVVTIVTYTKYLWRGNLHVITMCVPYHCRGIIVDDFYSVFTSIVLLKV